VHAAGANNAHRIDELPEYFLWRMQTTVWVDWDETPDAHGHDQAPFPLLNVGVFVVEFGFVLVLVPFLGRVRAGRVYDEATGRWSNLLLAPLASGSGSTLRNALVDGWLPQAIAQTPRGHIAYNQPYCEMVAEHTTADARRPSPSPVYLSLRELRLPGPFGTLNYYLSFGILGVLSCSRELVRQCELNAKEVAALSRIFPALADRTGAGLNRA